MGTVMLAQEHIEDEDDKFIETLNTILILSLGILSISSSIILLTYTASTAILTQQLPTDLTNRTIFTAVLFGMGYATIHIFRKRRQTQKQKESALFLRRKT